MIAVREWFSGGVFRLVHGRDRVVKARSEINAMLEAATLQEQQEIYHGRLRERFWTRPLRFAMNRDATLSMVGVPRAQRRQLEADYEGGVVQFVRDCLDAVFGQLPLTDNYFWRVYITGSYTPGCCPEYLKPDNFQRLKAGLVDCIHVHTDTLQGFLEKYREEVSRFVLLEHFGQRIADLAKVYVVDLCPSLLAVARQRVQRHGWTNVELVEADVASFHPAEPSVDVVTFSYSLTMVPNWFAAVEQAHRLLRPGGLIGVVDFYVSRKHPPPGWCRHGWWTRTFWPAWFARDNVFLSADHVPFLHQHFLPVHFQEHRARLPYVPLLRVPYYTFAGRSRQTRTTRLDLLGPWPHSSG